MNVTRFHIDGPVLIEPVVHSDSRGHFVEAYRRDRFDDAFGRPIAFVQDNESLSLQRGTIRGLHYQAPPRAQDKLVRCIRGEIVSLIVDVRKGSPTYGQALRTSLSEERIAWLLVPKGFLNGFATMRDETVVSYKVTDSYAPECDGAVRYDSLGLDWGLGDGSPILSEKDRNAPVFEDWTSPF